MKRKAPDTPTNEAIVIGEEEAGGGSKGNIPEATFEGEEQEAKEEDTNRRMRWALLRSSSWLRFSFCLSPTQRDAC